MGRERKLTSVRVLGVFVVFLAVTVSALATSGAHACRRVGCFIVGALPAKHRPATFCASSRLYAYRSIYSTSRKQDSDIHVSMSRKDHYRADGVRIQHDPYAQGMAEKYGRPGETDADGFDPYADSVGPGIYGGKVQRDAMGKVIMGRQFQNHNPEPGPVYTGEGYTDMSKALSKGEEAVKELLDRDPALVNEISTGGAQPLHMAGMSGRNQRVTAYLISRGGDIEALDTYGYRPLHRMASNNLAVGAKALLEAGAQVNAKTKHGETPLSIARGSAAHDVIKVLLSYNAK